MNACSIQIPCEDLFLMSEGRDQALLELAES